jgi:hypothetical protein
MKDWYVGIDNGVTGSIGVLGPKGIQQFHTTPVKKELNYTKTKAWINRIDTAALKIIFDNLALVPANSLVLIERPMVNPGRFKATVSALRALEATLITVESFNLPIRYVDSKEWQQNILPEGLEGPEELKAASLSIGKRLFPNLTFKKDADSILMAEWARRNNL